MKKQCKLTSSSLAGCSSRWHRQAEMSFQELGKVLDLFGSQLDPWHHVPQTVEHNFSLVTVDQICASKLSTQNSRSVIRLSCQPHGSRVNDFVIFKAQTVTMNFLRFRNIPIQLLPNVSSETLTAHLHTL